MPNVIPDDEMDDLVEWLETIWLAGAADTSSAALAAAHRYALEHAGDLVGMHWNVERSVWEQAVRPAYRIAEDLRERLNELVSEGIGRGDSVASIREALDPLIDQIPQRALVAARTESATVLNAGTIAAGTMDGVELWRVHDGPGCLPYGHDDAAPECDPDFIGVQLDAQADGQLWRPRDAGRYLISHPNCVRYLEPVVITPEILDALAAAGSE